jgi:hypothetical protein
MTQEECEAACHAENTKVRGSCTGWHHGRIASDWCGVWGTFLAEDTDGCWSFAAATLDDGTAVTEVTTTATNPGYLCFRTCGSPGTPACPPVTATEEDFAAIDTDGDGELSEDELAVVSAEMEPGAVTTLMQLDVNGDGRLQKEEFVGHGMDRQWTQTDLAMDAVSSALLRNSRSYVGSVFASLMLFAA